jgi:hypothetical protein
MQIREITVQHDLKCWPEFFAPIYAGMKNFDLRRNDRNYQIGDIVKLREWIPETHSYTGREVVRHVVYVLAGNGNSDSEPLQGLLNGFAILALKEFKDDYTE